MTPVESLIKDHNPAEGRYGDCFRACIASLLDLPAEEVPHFCDGLDDDAAEDAPGAVDAARRFIFEHTGCTYVEFPVTADDLDTMLSSFCARLKDVHYTLLGASGRANHVVVGCGDKIVHDPTYGTPHGIKGPCRDGLFWVGVLLRP